MDKARKALDASAPLRSAEPSFGGNAQEAVGEQVRSAVRRRLLAEERFLAVLERVADELPQIDSKLVAEISERLPRLAAALDRDAILEFLLQQEFDPRQERIRRQIQRLTLEGKADCSSVLELSEAIEPVLAGECLRDVGALAYLLRGVLENRRRHLVWTDEVISHELPTISKEDHHMRRALEETKETATRLWISPPPI